MTRRLTLADHADLDVFYDADSPRYRGAGEHVLKLVTKERFIRYYRNCPSIGFEFDGKPIGGIIYDGKGAHIAVLPEYHARWALLLRPALQWLFSIKSEMLVEVEVENAACIEFMKRNGWPALGTTDGWITYRMTQHPRRHGPRAGS
ncbi:N-acetyltransferase [Burkholderia sp. WAC0059]|uniref:N-acetyltransferase n=1 Tax=Burkholderia sp. WAC0059 TaxID=2066022 RepID=UPI000C7E8C26|nr:N-acetyltransferase [Burkholderia sp. WAC0059]PLZ03607.1 N-acetyltransferase [Burkholderia sp. WAC0059]